MDISVVILNYNHQYFIKLAVEALEKSVFKGKFEIILVDNASKDQVSVGFMQEAEKEGRITFIQNPKNIGFGAGNNVGVKVAKGKYIFIHNPDVTIQPDSLQRLFDYAEQHKEIGILAPQLRYANGYIQESCRRDMKFVDLVIKRTFLAKIQPFKKRLQLFLMEDYDHSKTMEAELVTGAAMFIARKTFEKIGGFDERYPLFMEDFDLCREVRKAGFKVVYFPECQISHYHKRLSNDNLFKSLTRRVFWLHVISAFKYFWKWRDQAESSGKAES